MYLGEYYFFYLIKSAHYMSRNFTWSAYTCQFPTASVRSSTLAITRGGTRHVRALLLSRTRSSLYTQLITAFQHASQSCFTELSGYSAAEIRQRRPWGTGRSLPCCSCYVSSLFFPIKVQFIFRLSWYISSVCFCSLVIALYVIL